MSEYDVLVDVVKATPVDESTVFIEFSDGKSGNVDLTKIMHGPLFEELVKKGQLMDFTVSTELGTLVWPNSLDIAPEVLWVEAAHIPRDF